MKILKLGPDALLIYFAATLVAYWCGADSTTMRLLVQGGAALAAGAVIQGGEGGA